VIERTALAHPLRDPVLLPAERAVGLEPVERLATGRRVGVGVDRHAGGLVGPGTGPQHRVDPGGDPGLLGDAEVDLAMLMLFGTPPPVFLDAYGPLPPGYAERRAIYQLWPALVHMRLFGAAYRGMVNGLLAEVGA